MDSKDFGSQGSELIHSMDVQQKIFLLRICFQHSILISSQYDPGTLMFSDPVRTDRDHYKTTQVLD